MQDCRGVRDALVILGVAAIVLIALALADAFCPVKVVPGPDRLSQWSGPDLVLIRMEMFDKRDGKRWTCLPGRPIVAERDCVQVRVK